MNISSKDDGKYVINKSKCKVHLEKFDDIDVALRYKEKFVHEYEIMEENVHEYEIMEENVLLYKDNVISAD